MVNRDGDSLVMRMSNYNVAEAIIGNFMKTVEIPVILIMANQDAEERLPVAEYPKYHTQKEDGYDSIIVPPYHRRIYDNLLKDRKNFRMQDALAKFNVTDIEASVIEEAPTFTHEVILFMKGKVRRVNPRTRAVEILREGIRNSVEITIPGDAEPAPGPAVTPESAPVPADPKNTLKRGK